MERQANYVLVGVIGVLLLISAFVFVVWFAHFQFNQQYDKYAVHFRGPVAGSARAPKYSSMGSRLARSRTSLSTNRTRTSSSPTSRSKPGLRYGSNSTATPVTQGITGVKFVQVILVRRTSLCYAR